MLNVFDENMYILFCLQYPITVSFFLNNKKSKLFFFSKDIANIQWHHLLSYFLLWLFNIYQVFESIVFQHSRVVSICR